MITGSINLSRAAVGDHKAALNGSVAAKAAENKNNIGSTPSGATGISSLASQLAASAAYSSGKNKGLSFTELGDKARTLLDQIVGDGFSRNKARNDREVPKATDAASLERAKAATVFANGSFEDNVGSEPNPFAGMSSEQLATIAYDESGTFTANERYAAYRESYLQEQTWRITAVARMQEEYNSTGKLTNFFKEVLAHYEGLPLMEQVQYPKDYAADLKEKIRKDFNYFESVVAGGGQGAISAAKSFLRPMLEPSGFTTQP
ncbi:hypothetical protein NHH88_22405 [Oxalobacteraceae bacterium OTU3CAMAD1]|nr:hypothetical protein NHH88_22405 [Oxalobacteraceae bacterium OTU3CAMAD1]